VTPSGRLTPSDVEALPPLLPRPPHVPVWREWEDYKTECFAMLTLEERAETDRTPVPLEQEVLKFDVASAVDDEVLHQAFIVMKYEQREAWRKSPPLGRCGVCGRRAHDLKDPETPVGVRIGTLLVDPAPGNVPPGSWCLYSAVAHRFFYEEFADPGAGVRFTRESAIAEAQRVEARTATRSHL
jgi:hypothetical protein